MYTFCHERANVAKIRVKIVYALKIFRVSPVLVFRTRSNDFYIILLSAQKKKEKGKNCILKKGPRFSSYMRFFFF